MYTTCTITTSKHILKAASLSMLFYYSSTYTTPPANVRELHQKSYSWPNEQNQEHEIKKYILEALKKEPTKKEFKNTIEKTKILEQQIEKLDTNQKKIIEILKKIIKTLPEKPASH